ncbi:hypothetical protein [Salinigranum salinum]|uniref:hypothetical protein n=1 Tax=Salinigranum salinum TaxID=1364937 RepID=UPI0012612F04|nr:hypothetical protein [Salinigranum salinum]
MALSDRNRFEENRLESGSLELGLAWEERYNGTTQEDEGVCGSETWDAYHDVSEAIVELDAVEPGDSGTLDVCLRLSANVDSTWMRLLVHSVAENGVNSTEEQAGDVTPDVGELQKYLEVTVQTDSDCETARETSPRIEGDLAQMGAGPLGTGMQLAEATRCVIIEWQLPEDVPATILTDSVEFAIDFAAVQSRPDDSQSPWANSNS